MIKLNNYGELGKALLFGLSRRMTSKTERNDYSSRSHAIFSLYLSKTVSKVITFA